MASDDLIAWLGPAAAELTTDQLDLVVAAAADIHRRYPDDDELPEREAALFATVQYLLGETTAEEAGRELIAARARERAAYVAAVQVAVLRHRHEHTPKATAARESSIDRMSLLEALGERPQRRRRN